MQKNRKKRLYIILALLVIGGIVLALPPVWSRVSYYTNKIYTEIYYKINPPQAVIFNPSESTPDEMATAVKATMNALVTPTTAVNSPTPEPTLAPTPTRMPLPPSIYLAGTRTEAQMWNNCGPATLSMALSFWQWTGGNQEDTAAVLKPNNRDKNVMPYEMLDYVNNNTNLRAIMRMGGDLYTIKALLNAGFPVLVEKGFEPENLAAEGWMGHYNLVIGYDDTKQEFTTQDSYLLAVLDSSDRPSAKGFKVTYDDMTSNWRAFNYIFVVVYPPDMENDVLNALGPLADQTNAFRLAAELAASEAASLTDARDQYFAWYNTGTSLVNLAEYDGAAAAFDKAFAIYPSIDETHRPYRMLWYQTGPYFAYYYTARYQDVISLATTTLDAEVEHILEESYHWRAMAELQLGQQDAAIADFQNALKVHPGFGPSYEQMVQLGITP
jgi:tetratricopeptide (TPR) repeat protein